MNLINMTFKKKKKRRKSFLYCNFIYSTYMYELKKKVSHINFIFGLKIILFFPTQMKHLFHDGETCIAL